MAAGGDYQVRVRQRLAYRLLDGVARIRHRHLPGDHVAEVGQPAAQPLLMRIQHPPQHQFTARIDNFNIHARSVGWESPAGKFLPVKTRWRRLVANSLKATTF